MSSNVEENQPMDASDVGFLTPPPGIVEISLAATNVTFAKECTGREEKLPEDAVRKCVGLSAD